MKIMGKNWRTQRNTCSSANLPTTNPTWTSLGSNPFLRSDRLAAKRMVRWLLR